jgi:myo-inositol-1-phosphate synthase
MKRLTLIGLLLVNQVLAQDVVYLKKGEVTPYEGYLFSQAKESEVRLKLLDADVYKQLDASNQRIIGYHVQEKALLQQQANLWHTQADSLSKQLVNAEDRSFWRNTLFFLAGALITTGIAYGVTRATR